MVYQSYSFVLPPTLKGLKLVLFSAVWADPSFMHSPAVRRERLLCSGRARKTRHVHPSRTRL